MTRAPFRPAASNCHHRFFSLEEFFRSSAESGFDTVELWTGPMHFFLDYASNDDVGDIAKLAERHGMRFCAVCPEQNNPKPANIAARGAAAVARTELHFKRAIDLASSLGANIVTATSGWGFLDEPREDAWHRSVCMLRTLAGYAGDRDVTLAIEALQPEESNLCNTVKDLMKILDDVGSPRLKVLLDTGAMWRAGERVTDYMDTFGSDVIHCHFTDAGETSHLAWGDGDQDIVADLLGLLRGTYRGFLTFENVDSRYFADPAEADRKSIAAYEKALEEIGL